MNGFTTSRSTLKLLLFLSAIMCLKVEYSAAQELGYNTSWMVGLGVSKGNIRSIQHSVLDANDALLVKELENFGPRTGWQLGLGHFYRLARKFGWVSEFSVMYSRRKGQLTEVLSTNYIIYNQTGNLNYSNVHLQLFTAPRLQFGTFNRFYASAGPYVDYNLWNLSSFNGTKISYYEKQNIQGDISYRKLDQPESVSTQEKSNIRQFDFGGMICLGTLLALPGNNLIQLEIRYSRGAFRISDTPGVRQNRFLLVMGYSITGYQAENYQKYMPFL